MFPVLLGRHQGHLLEDVGGRRLLRNQSQLQMLHNPVQDGILREGGDGLHPLPDWRQTL